MPGIITPNQTSINPAAFLNLCSKIGIESKRYGTCPLVPIATQVYLIEEIVKGLNEGVHQFVVLKPRQSGTTTIILAFLMYWMMRFPGVTGGFSFDDNDKQTAMNYEDRRMIHSLHPAAHECYFALNIQRRGQVAFLDP